MVCLRIHIWKVSRRLIRKHPGVYIYECEMKLGPEPCQLQASEGSTEKNTNTTLQPY